MIHAAKIIIIPHSTKLFVIFFINNQKSAINNQSSFINNLSPPLCAPAPTAHKHSHIVRQTLAQCVSRALGA